MDAEMPVQPTAAPKPPSWWSARRVCAILALLFIVIFAASWLLTPIAPYATLDVDEKCGLYLFSPDGTVFVTSGPKRKAWFEGPFRIWDVERGNERFSLVHDWKAIRTVLFSPDSSLLAAHDWEGELKLWNTRTGKEVASIRTRAPNWMNFRFSPDGRFLVFQDYSKRNEGGDHITFWNIKSKKEQGSIRSYFYTLAFGRDGESFATFLRDDLGKINEVLLWNMDQVPMLTKEHRISTGYIAFSPDLKTFVTADDLPDDKCQIVMWDMLTGQKRWSVTFDEHNTHLKSLSFIANGKVLSADCVGFTRHDRRKTLWDVTLAPKEIGSFSETPAVSPDGEWLAIPLDSGAKLVKASTPERGTDLVVNGDCGPPGREFGIGDKAEQRPTPAIPGRR